MTWRSTNALDLSGSSVTTSEVSPTLSVPPVTGPLDVCGPLELPQPASTTSSAHSKLSHRGSAPRIVARCRAAEGEMKLRDWKMEDDEGKDRTMREPPRSTGYIGTHKLVLDNSVLVNQLVSDLSSVRCRRCCLATRKCPCRSSLSVCCLLLMLVAAVAPQATDPCHVSNLSIRPGLGGAGTAVDAGREGHREGTLDSGHRFEQDNGKARHRLGYEARGGPTHAVRRANAAIEATDGGR